MDPKNCNCKNVTYSHERVLTGPDEGRTYLVSTCRECGATYRTTTGHDRIEVVNLNGHFLDANEIDAVIVEDKMPRDKQVILQQMLSNSFPDSKAAMFFGLRIRGVKWPELLAHDLGLTHICPQQDCMEGYAFPETEDCPKCGSSLIELPNPKTNKAGKEK